MQKIIKKFYLGSFYVITLLLSGLLLILHVVFKTAGRYSVSFPQLAPAFAVLVLAVILKDETELHKIKEYLSFRKISIEWIAVLLVLACVFIISSSLIMTLLGSPLVPWSGNWLFYLLSILAMLIGCFTEEIGWRGFLLPHLQERYSPFLSSIIIGILWGAWHLNFDSGIWGFILFTVTCIEMSLLMTYIFNKTNSSLVLMFLWHFIINLLSHIFLLGRFGVSLYLVECIVFGAVCAVVVIADRERFFSKPQPVLQ